LNLYFIDTDGPTVLLGVTNLRVLNVCNLSIAIFSNF